MQNNIKHLIRIFKSIRRNNNKIDISNLVRSLSQRSKSPGLKNEVVSSDFNDHKLTVWKTNFLLIYGDSPLAKVLVERLSTHLARRFRSKGIRETLKFFKGLENFLRLTFMRIPVQIDQTTWTQMVPQDDGTMIPKVLSVLGRQLGSLNHQEQQMFLTAIQIYKLIIIEPEYEYKTIVEPGPDFERDSLSREAIQDLLDNDPFRSPRALIEHINRFVSEQKLKSFEVKDSIPGPIFSTTKAGVNGPKANSLTGYIDYHSLKRNPIQFYAVEQLLNHLFTEKDAQKVHNLMDKINIEVNSEGFKSKMLDLSSQKNSDRSIHDILSTMYPLVKDSILGRIHVFSEGGGKTRIIAIFDMWSQTVLAPIHNHLMKMLKSFGQSDGTFDHSACAELYGRKTTTPNIAVESQIEEPGTYVDSNGRTNKKFYCFDLTAATDRMPLYLQERVISNIFPKEVVSAWSILLQRDFALKGFKDKTVKYKAGQPMGALSSWPAMALTHHMIIKWALKESIDKSYAVIGDDMLLACPHAANRYLEACSLLGMPINLNKSVVPSAGSLPAIELAKRVYVAGKQISPIPCEVLLNSRKTVTGFLDFYNTIAERIDDYHASDEVGGGADQFYVNKVNIIKNFFDMSTKFNRTRICITMSYPYLSDLGMISKEIKGLDFESWWDLSLSKWELTTFIMGRWNKSINDREFLMAGIDPVTMRPSKVPTDAKHSSYYHNEIVKSIEEDITKEYKDTMRLYSTNYVDEEGDSDDLNISLEDMYKFIIGSPNPLDLREFIDPHSKKHTNVISDMISDFWLESKEGSIPSDFQSNSGRLNVNIKEFASWHRPAKQAKLNKSNLK